MKTLLLHTDGNWAGLLLRLFLAIIIFPHGAQKMLGWFGGYGFNGTMDFFTGTLRLPWIISFLVILIEFAGALFLAAGFGSRLAAVAMIILMVGIIVTSHLQNGFFMNWFGNQKGEGYEYHLAIIGLAAGILFTGSGKFSLDAMLQ